MENFDKLLDERSENVKQKDNDHNFPDVLLNFHS